ncbi:WD40 repeat-like protein [Martensiomyces pterosporus]|nr:WD40 repeat-like protein [Martensiomyces pterosporus]
MVPSAPLSSRVTELLDALRGEYDTLNQEASTMKAYRDEYEQRFNSQINEMQAFQQSLFELERAHQKIKQQYEEEILRLRRELETRGGPPVPPGPFLQQQQQQQQQPPLPPQGQQPIPMSQPHSTGIPPGSQPPPPPQGQPHVSQGPGGMYGGMPPSRQTPTQPPRSVVVAAKQSVGSSNQLADMDPDTVPPQMKREGPDWFVIFNPKIPRQLNIENLSTLEHNSVVCCVKFSNDGKLLATGCNRTTQIWSVATGMKECVLADENAPKNGDLYIRAVCFSPDGKYLVTGAEDKQIRIWDVQKKVIRHILTGHDQDIYSLDFSPDGRTILSGSGDRTVRLWDLESGKNIHTFSIDDMGPKDAGVTSVAFSPNGQLVAAASLDKMIRLWDATTGQFLERIDGHKDSVYAVAFAPDGLSLLSGSLDKTLRIWDLARPSPNGRPTGPSTCRSTLSGHKDFVLSVAYSPDGHWIISGSKDRGVQFWDPRTSQTQCMLQGHKNSVISVALSPTQSLFATGSGDCRARIWSYEQLPNQIPPTV